MTEYLLNIAINELRLDDSMEIRDLWRPKVSMLYNTMLFEMDAAGVCMEGRDIADFGEMFNQIFSLYIKWHCNYCDNGPEYEKAFRELLNAMALCITEPVPPPDSSPKGGVTP